MESEPTAEPMNYASPRDEALHSMAAQGWAQDSSGAEAAITGPFWRISNSSAELPDLQRMFGEEWERLSVDPQALLGDFVLGHNSTAEIGVVMSFETEDQAVQAFETLKRVYEAERDGLL